MQRQMLSIVRRMSQMVGKVGRFLWIHCEMTDFDHEKQALVEIAVKLTGKDFKVPSIKIQKILYFTVFKSFVIVL
ncbi:hypothetical protein KIN20_031860 [Parelaphostrongylus tenuis]|uniref:Uncharacterized protein n=1 Tax=Parelaphostrongylus tenuis TaxID=148309 RepID=A0AAD5WH29_PARTN|nr:hypothetical protein KIN20_031860 [Parelaphostrongylus tenuis]